MARVSGTADSVTVTSILTAPVGAKRRGQPGNSTKSQNHGPHTSIFSLDLYAVGYTIDCILFNEVYPCNVGLLWLCWSLYKQEPHRKRPFCEIIELSHRNESFGRAGRNSISGG